VLESDGRVPEAFEGSECALFVAQVVHVLAPRTREVALHGVFLLVSCACGDTWDSTRSGSRVKGGKREAFYKVQFFVPLTLGSGRVPFAYPRRYRAHKDSLTVLQRLDLLVHC
jgi:hypothetical protein